MGNYITNNKKLDAVKDNFLPPSSDKGKSKEKSKNMYELSEEEKNALKYLNDQR